MTTYIVATYDHDLAYGGPEEGGWWYDVGTLVKIMRTFRNEETAFDYCRKLNARLNSREFGPNEGKREITSVLSEGAIQAEVYEDYAPKGYPERRPHYE